MIKEDLTHRKFGRLTVLYQAEERHVNGSIQWVCQCDCEDKTIVVVPTNRLKGKKTKSCGCLQKECVVSRKKNNAKYSEDDRNTRIYRIWKAMIARTTYPSQSGYKNYGGDEFVEELVNKQEFIEKAKEWLEKTLYIHTEIEKDRDFNEIMRTDWVTSDYDTVEDFINGFCKAMEE